MRKVFIPCAGLGERLGKLTNNVNKALVSLGHKPLISIIIEKFDPKTNFVIALGYKGSILREYLDLVYPNLNIQYVEIPIFQGKESSLGVTLLECKNFLQEPFVFWACDTIIDDNIPNLDKNWIGVSNKEKDVTNYRSVKPNETILSKIYSKKSKINRHPYIGIAGILSYKEFWETLKNSNLDMKKSGEVLAINKIAEDHEVIIKKLNWIDAGNKIDLENNQKKFLSKDINILPKDNECIWFANNLVTKFSIDTKFIKSRIKRADRLYPYVPKIVAYGKHMYSYQFVIGEVFSKQPSKEKFYKLLEFCKNFWKINKDVNLETFYSNCYDFYFHKTNERLAKINKIDSKLNKISIINKIEVCDIYDLLKAINWESITKGIPSRFHGDLHFENILNTSSNNSFVFLDWRQDFSSNISVGDIYYDLAKIYHGIIVSHKKIAQNKFNIKYKNENEVQITLELSEILMECEEIFKVWVEDNKYDFEKIMTLTALIYLNISPLHHNPYNDFLFFLGKLILQNIHNKKDIAVIVKTLK